MNNDDDDDDDDDDGDGDGEVDVDDALRPDVFANAWPVADLSHVIVEQGLVVVQALTTLSISMPISIS